jgi:CheY-like chemotaxis protein
LTSFSSREKPEQGAPGALDWSKFRYLVVEDSPTMRAWLRQAIVNMGGKSVTEAAGYSDAIYRLNNQESFDIVLCDYILSLDKYMTLSGGQRALARDGQHLLEECRHRKLLPSASVFIMVTGESLYEKVFAVAELAPDDYLLKPMKPSLLAERLTRAIIRKQALKGMIELFDDQEYSECMETARAFLDADSTYLLDCQRLVGDCLLKLGRNEEVIRHFENLLIDHPGLAWAKMGLARARFHLDRYDESRDILESLVAENGDFAQAHDLLARVHEVKGSSQKSRALLKEVLIRNPRAIHRHREVVRMALDIGDTQDAVAAYEGMFSHGAGSVSVSPSDFAGFGSLLLQNSDQGNVQRLTQLISVLNDYYLKLNTGGDQTGYQVAELVAQFARARLKGNDNETARFYEQIGAAVKDLPAVDNEMKLSLMEVAIAAGDQAKASEIAREVLADYHGNESMTRRILGTLENGGLGSEAEAMRLDTERAVADLNRKAVTLAKSGKPKEAMVEFMRLADTTRNLSITFNAALAIVHWLESAAPEDMLSRKLAHYIEVIRNRDPANPRTRQIEEMAQPYLRVAASMGAAANGRP